MFGNDKEVFIKCGKYEFKYKSEDLTEVELVDLALKNLQNLRKTMKGY